VLGFVEEAEGRLRCGESILLLEERVDAPSGVELPVRGWAYLTVQVRDCDAEVARIEAAGASVASRPRNLGEVARMAMVRDPDGNPIELSQRASLTGPLLHSSDPRQSG
jgi:lactoylglutathione lyase